MKRGEEDGRSSCFRRRDVNARQNGLAPLAASGSLPESSLASMQFTRLGVCMWKIDSTKSVQSRKVYKKSNITTQDVNTCDKSLRPSQLKSNVISGKLNQ